ncbi:MAG: cyclodeaminase/cyclohydrolase family protein [Candidatus Thermoplasmatota archaeon]|nr:cyclodeaminase/cyclohydrolase family protein [Candidatus Thermoplasmatota archaeon]
MRAFCAELAEDQPSPGGGSASAAAGAMAASLLAMVCGITAKSKKYADKAEIVGSLRGDLLALQSKLLDNAKSDSEAYDMVIAASRLRREKPGEEAEAAFEAALKHAADVPMRAAEACSAVLEAGLEVAELGARSAWSDTATALLLGEAGLRGAALNVRINLDSIHDRAYAGESRRKIDALVSISQKRFSEAMAKLLPTSSE